MTRQGFWKLLKSHGKTGGIFRSLSPHVLGTLLQPICLKVEQTSVAYRRCWDIPMWERLKFTPT